MSERQFPKLKDVIPISNGVFGHMTYTFRAEVTKAQLDYLLMASFSKRNPAPVIDLLYDEETEEPASRMLTEAELTTLADLMLSYYKPRWDKLGEVYDVEYDPIHNYLDEWEDENDGSNASERVLDSDRRDTLNTTVTKSNLRTDNLSELMTRSLTDSNTRTLNNTDATTYGKTDTRTDNNTIANTGTVGNSGTSTDTNQIKAFNSNSFQDTTKTSGTDGNTRTDNLLETHAGTVTNALSGRDSTAHTGTVTDSGSEGGTVTTANTGTQTDSGSEATTGTNSRATDETESNEGTDHRERSGRHFGNIGNLTSQKMLKEEIELWKWNYVQSILEDARDFLTLPVYLG